MSKEITIPESVVHQIIDDHRKYLMQELKEQHFNREIPDDVLVFAITRFIERTNNYPSKPYVIPETPEVEVNEYKELINGLR